MSCTLVCRRIRPTEPDWAFKVTLRDAIYKRAGGRSGGTLTAADVSYLEGLRDMTPLKETDHRALNEMIEAIEDGSEIIVEMEC